LASTSARNRDALHDAGEQPRLDVGQHRGTAVEGGGEQQREVQRREVDAPGLQALHDDVGAVAEDLRAHDLHADGDRRQYDHTRDVDPLLTEAGEGTAHGVAEVAGLLTRDVRHPGTGDDGRGDLGATVVVAGVAGRAVGRGGAHAASCCLVWDATISA
jgi:hypothetical protein